jgi:hypothetical protein
MMVDTVTPRLRKIEREIDSEYKANPLVSLPFGEACWNVMVFYEDYAIRDIVRFRTPTVHELAAKADYIVVQIQYPLRWLSEACKREPKCSYTYSEANYGAAFRLFDLAHNYNPFDSAFTYASHGYVNLQLDRNVISVIGGLLTDSRYEAYDRLILVSPKLPDFTYTNIISLIQPKLIVKEDNFHYQLGRRFVSQIMDFLLPVFEEQFHLPTNWVFPRYSVVEFRRLASVLGTLGFIHHIARLLAASQGCAGLAINNAILLIDPDRLFRLLARYSGIEGQKVNYFIEDFTYGSRGVKHPDPALQPIIPLDSKTLAIMPNIIINCSMERNWISLMNRIAEDRLNYLKLTNEKEDAMRRTILSKLTDSSLRIFHGRIPGAKDLPDIDLALISQRDKAVILAELKWFIAPAEVREVIEKSEEIRKGITQALILSQAYAESPHLFQEALGIDFSYTISFIVLSENMIGQDWVQDSRIPVLQADHFCRKASELSDLRILIDWITLRHYLPTEGIHYRVAPMRASIGRWILDWYGIEPLISGLFDP